MKFISALLIILCFSRPSQAQYFQMDLMKKRQSNKESSRWTLGDWLSQKQRIGLWDHWLSMNRSANWFEMELGYSQFQHDYITNSGGGDTTVEETADHFYLGLWVTIFGLQAEYDDWKSGTEARTGMLNLRLVGSSLQSTHILLRGGVQKIENTSTGEEWENPFVGGVLKLYFLSFIGLEGEYRKFQSKESNQGTKLEGSRTRAGMFIEFGSLQLHGHYWNEPYETTSGGTTTTEERDGFDMGLALIF